MQSLFLIIASALAIASAAPVDEQLKPFDDAGKYLLSGFKASWVEAGKFCTDLGLGLLNVETEEENEVILASFGISDRVWIGGTGTEKQFWWTQNMVPFTFTSWHEFEPSGINPGNGQTEDCVLYWNNEGIIKWNDAPCENEYLFICEALTTN